MDDKNLMIRVLEWATQQEQFTFQDLCAAVNLSGVEQNQLKILIHNKSLLFHNHTTFYSSVDKADINIFASAEDHFRYLEYVELKEARESSKDANKKALIAIGIAVVSTLTSIVMSIAAINSDINVPDKMYDILDESHTSILRELKELRKEQSVLTSKLESNNLCLINSDPTYK